MKIYTEIIWSWDDDKGELVQESEKSYDYDGPLTLAHERQRTQYLEYPPSIGQSLRHWVTFESFDFREHFNKKRYRTQTWKCRWWQPAKATLFKTLLKKY